MISQNTVFILMAVVLFFATAIVIYPNFNKKSLLLGVGFIFIVSFSFYSSGFYKPLQEYEKHLYLQEQFKKISANPQGIDNLIQAVKNKITPKDAKGWFILGRLYSSANKQVKACLSLEKAYKLQPDNMKYKIYYAYALWGCDKYQAAKDIFSKILKHDPNQVDALAFMARDNFASKNFEQAVSYWQQILNTAVLNTAQAAKIRQAIVEAHNQQEKTNE